MGIDRRKFMKFAGVTAVAGLTGNAPLKTFADEPAVTGSTADTAADKAVSDGAPLVAKRWAMVIDLKKCMKEKGCTDCINACHQIHNVPEFDNPKDEIKWVWKESFKHSFHEQELEHIPEDLKHGPTLLLCNHCDRPPCVKVCPTQATWRREDGLIVMDWHRCIGCRYCIAACPYGSRSFNWRDPRPFIKEMHQDYPTRTRGVVEKCTFCEERLAIGKVPACVEACREKALIFGDLEDPHSEVREILHSNFTIRRKPGLGTHPEVYYIV